jgi:hypothetical protein
MSLKLVLPILAVILLVSGCSNDDSTLDPAITDSPIVFIDMELSHYFVDTDTLNVVAGTDKSPDDIVTIPLKVTIRMQRNAIGGSGATLRCVVTPDGQRDPVAEKVITGLTTGVHAFDVDLTLRRGDVGDYSVEVIGEEAGNVHTATALANLRVTYGTKSPQILDVSAPDTLTLQGQPITFDISVLVDDPNGQADIKNVLMYSYWPDGRPASGNPFTLLDNGQSSSGDAVAGDGWFSIRVQLPVTTQLGEWDFQFRAVDYSNTISNVVIHKLIVR